MLEMLLHAAVHHAQGVRIERVSASRIVFAVALVAHHGRADCKHIYVYMFIYLGQHIIRSSFYCVFFLLDFIDYAHTFMYLNVNTKSKTKKNSTILSLFNKVREVTY